jgi:hypothetical protein
MNPEQAHAILSGAASRALLNEADRFAVIQARDTLGVFVKEHLPKVTEEVATLREVSKPPQANGAMRAADLEKLNGRTKR